MNPPETETWRSSAMQIRCSVSCETFPMDHQIPVHKKKYLIQVVGFHNYKPLKKMLLDSWMVGDIDYAFHRDSNNKGIMKLWNVCKEALCAVSIDDKNCTIILYFLVFDVLGYMVSRKTTKKWQEEKTLWPTGRGGSIKLGRGDSCWNIFMIKFDPLCHEDCPIPFGHS